ncbi:50S ribosomal protein L10 [Thermogymnomonas acidicola]|uniref:Large ribosomal subunit protein uL10 n=1 Tax=Thermogymnomonas acidicola TaxID=399579 RepID=A0AA37BQX0_9ARCH|nr:50S ribosomal protein L10 [Thermogymnomonas acidicola]GGM71241.1 50S ribosomal protein L10 [Thermogymnomonas acidicola]
MRKPAQWKVELVDQVAKEISSSNVTAIVSIKGLRNKQFQDIRKSLRGEVKIRVMRGTLIKKALEKAQKKDIKGLEQFVSGQVAVVTGNIGAPVLYRRLEGTKQRAPARGGEIADHDIVVEAKETSFPPGPMISEFQKVGLQTAIEKGKIVIKKEAVLVKKGEVITPEKAKVLERLEIFPLIVGLDVLGAYEDGIIFTKESLSITPEQVAADVATAFARAKALALRATFMVPEVVPELLAKAKLEADALALAAGFLTESNVQLFILKAIREANALNAALQGGSESPAAEEARGEEKKEEEKSGEEDASAGLSALFG